MCGITCQRAAADGSMSGHTRPLPSDVSIYVACLGIYDAISFNEIGATSATRSSAVAVVVHEHERRSTERVSTKIGLD